MRRVSQTCSSTSRSIRLDTYFYTQINDMSGHVFISRHQLNDLTVPPVLRPSAHKALQKDVLTNASALNEVIASTKRFLEENRSKLTPDQITVLESKLEEAKSKAKLIDQRAEESRKDLEKVVTTAIKQESEKVRVPVSPVGWFPI